MRSGCGWGCDKRQGGDNRQGSCLSRQGACYNRQGGGDRQGMGTGRQGGGDRQGMGTGKQAGSIAAWETKWIAGGRRYGRAYENLLHSSVLYCADQQCGVIKTNSSRILITARPRL
jgi:hypothetical protein